MIEKIIDQLDIKKVFFGSGARNLSLLSVFRNCELELGFDERSLSFQALGYAKVHQRAVAIVTTSGTAVAECLPAMIEAYYTLTPLVLITADRPDALRGTHAPQTIDQVSLMTSFRRSFSDGEQLIFKGFPVHINLAINLEQIDKPSFIYSEEKIPKIDPNQGCLLVLNQMRNKDITNLVKNIIDDKAPWVYQEIQSPFFSQVFENEVTSDEQVQSLLKRGKITSIIRIGDTPDSKFWRLLETQFRKTQVYHIGDFDTSALSFGQIIPEQQAVAWIESLDKVIPKGKPLSNQFSNHHKWRAQFPQSEPALILDYLEQIDIKPGIVLVGNSMPIRYARWYRPKQIKYMANRGANGIDGLIATAAGMAKACKPMPVYCLIGDLSFFYDLSALVDLDLDNLHICVVNNQGGRIFERLSGGKAVVCEHGRTLKPYMKVFEANLGSLIELSVDNKQTANFWEWYAKQD